MTIPSIVDYDKGYAFKLKDETISVEMLYPPSDDERPNGHPRYIFVDMERTHATDGLRISYSVIRNGWVIEQAQVFRWHIDDPVCDPQWKEVAFVGSWGSELESLDD